MAIRKNKNNRSVAPAPGSDVLLVLGAGNMGQALVRGLIKAPAGTAANRPHEILLYDTHPAKCEQLLAELATNKDQSAIALHMLRDEDELRSALPRAAVIALCTKPQDLPAVATGCHGKIKKDALLISVAAGVSLERIATLFKHRGPVVRAMPNIAAKVGAAATGMSASKECGTLEMEKATAIFAAIGEALWIREDLLNAVTGLSGSGPAYIFMVIEALTEGGVKMGIPRDIARQLATQTVYGSAALLKSSGLHPATLREQVTTPGGTTVSAIHELEERGLRAMLMSAVSTATRRAEELEQSTTKPK